MGFRDEEDVRETLKLAAQTAENLDDEGQHTDAIAPILICRTLRWVLDEEKEDEENLRKQLQKDVKEIREE